MSTTKRKKKTQPSLNVNGSINVNLVEHDKNMIHIKKVDFKALCDLKEMFNKDLCHMRKVINNQQRVNANLEHRLRVAEAKLNDIEKFGKIKPPVYGRSI
jgi:hypothetical protein